MKSRKIALSAAMAATLGIAGTSNATIIGVPSEGLLVPFGIAGVNSIIGGPSLQAFTGVLIETPALVGVDTIINDYTAPNTTKGGYTPPEDKGLWNGGMTVHYYMFDEKSEHVYDSTFVMSPDDVYFWVPPEATWPWIGYVVFADEAARKGGPATFVMTGQAGFALNVNGDDIADVPVVPLSDGDDAAGIRIGNEITYSPQQLPRIQDVVPLVAGTRYYGAPGTTTTIVTGLVPVWENYPGVDTIAHFMWFSENGMHADIDFCDDEEWCVSCTDWTFNEVNMLWHFPIGFVDGVTLFDEVLNCSGDDCIQEGDSIPATDNCGISGLVQAFGTVEAGASGLVSSEALNSGTHYAGIGLALYEFASKAGVAGVNFQVGFADFWGDNLLTAPMLTNGQF